MFPKTPEVNGDDGVPLLLGHVHEHPVAKDPGVVDEDVEAAELVERLLDHPLGAGEVGDVLRICSGFSAGGFDLDDDLLRRRVVVAFARERGTEVIDDDVRAGLRQRKRVRPADAASGAGDNRNLPREIRHLRENTSPWTST
jgi:hypothetical protein